MDTCVLIPVEFSVASSSSNGDGDDAAADSLAIWSRAMLFPGTTFQADQGCIFLEKLPCQSALKRMDVRNSFGCYDYVESKSGVRHCNWVRFLRPSSQTQDINMMAFKFKGQAYFQVIKMVLPRTEMVVYFANTDYSIDALLKEPHQPVGIAPYPRGYAGYMASPYLPPTWLTPQKNQSQALFPGTPAHSSPSQALSPAASGAVRAYAFGREPNTPVESAVYNQRNKRSCQSLTKRGKERMLLPCEVCGKPFDRPSLLKRHLRTHTGEKPHSCQVCGKSFSTSSSLNTHLRIHSGEKPHACNVCGKKFTASSNLYYHRMTHQKEKPHKCSLCSKSFPTPGDLKGHMYVHSGSWPYKCVLCNRGFSKQTNLKNHLILHSGQKPHVCTLPSCNKRFALACNLRAHLKTHAGDKYAAEKNAGKNTQTRDSRLENTKTPSPSGETCGDKAATILHADNLKFSDGPFKPVPINASTVSQKSKNDDFFAWKPLAASPCSTTSFMPSSTTQLF